MVVDSELFTWKVIQTLACLSLFGGRPQAPMHNSDSAAQIERSIKVPTLSHCIIQGLALAANEEGTVYIKKNLGKLVDEVVQFWKSPMACC